MKKIASAVAALCGGLLTLVSCQAVFTYSPVAFLERDLSSLSDSQKIERASDALESGSTEEIRAAYDAVASIIAAGGAGATTDNMLLAADLAFAGSGLTDVITSVAQNPDLVTSATTEELTTLFESFDADLVTAGATYVQQASADTNATITPSQYQIAGAALLASAAEQSGSGFDIINSPPAEGDAGYQDYQDALSFLELGGLDDLTTLFSL